uniref:Uncharacterized protein n=1 Tax=Arundo donax TaxID=35708 RepID=A0A0A9E2L6_ARUDO
MTRGFSPSRSPRSSTRSTASPPWPRASAGGARPRRSWVSTTSTPTSSPAAPTPRRQPSPSPHPPTPPHSSASSTASPPPRPRSTPSSRR